jgi:hypothetical protein
VTTRIACAALALALASCAGAPSGLPSAAGPGAPQPAAAKRERAKLELRLKIPARRPGRHAHFISPSTKSISIAEGAFKPKVFNTTLASPNCKSSSGAFTCTFTLGIQTGKNVPFLVTTYDKVNGGGNTLSVGRIAQTIVTGLNIIPITLSGVVSRIDVMLQNPNPPAGVAAKIPIVVLARDTDGNIIVGPASYESAITLSDTDKSGASVLSATKVTSPATAVSLSYTGGSLTAATIGASAPNVAPSNVVPATFAPNPVAEGDFILPIGSFSGTPIFGTAIASGADGNLWIAVCCFADSGIIVMHPGDGTILHYFTNGKSPSTALPQIIANGMLEGPNGAVWYASGGNVGFISTAGVVTNFSIAAACGGYAAQRLARDAGNTGMWVTIACTTGSRIAHITPAGAIAYYTVTTLKEPHGIIVGKDGHLYVAGQDALNDDGAILQATVAGGAITTTAIVDNTFATGPLWGIAQTPDGLLWSTANDCTNAFPLVQVHLVTPFTASNVTPFGTGPACSKPVFPAQLADGTLWVPNAGYALATRVISQGYPGYPNDMQLPLRSPNEAIEWDATVGSDGKIYIVDRSFLPTSSGDIAQVAN